MKKIFCITIFLIVLLLGCTNNEDCIIESVPLVDTNEFYNSNAVDSLFYNLESINSQIEKSNNVKTRGFGDLMRFLSIVAADAKGAYIGFKYGIAVLQITGGIIGGIIGAVIFSAATALQYKVPAYSEEADISWQRIKIVYSSVISNPKYEDLIILSADDVDISVPKRYEDAIKIGIMHNASLNLLSHKSLVNKDDTLMFTNDENIIFDSKEFIGLYDYLMENIEDVVSPDLAKIKQLPYYVDTDKISDKIIETFLKGVISSDGDMNTINNLVNSYIQEIESKDILDYEQKLAIYSAFSTCAYSASYWSKFGGLRPIDPEELL